MTDDPLLRPLPRLLAEAGLDPDGLRRVALPTEDQADGRRVVIRLDGRGRSLIYKAGPDRALDWEARQLAPLRAAAARLVGDPSHDVPAILAADAEARAVLMERAGGRTLSEAMEAAPDGGTLRALLSRAGAWARALHGEGTPAPFREAGIRDMLAAWRAEPPAGRDRTVEPDLAQALAGWAHGRMAEHEGAPTTLVLSHGDLTPENLLVAPGTVTGIDFDGLHARPPAIDLGWLIVRAVARAGPTADGVWMEMEAVRDAVLAGYGEAPAGLDAVMGWNVLRYAATFPPRPADRLIHAELFNLLRAARRMLGGDGGPLPERPYRVISYDALTPPAGGPPARLPRPGLRRYLPWGRSRG